MKRIVIVLGLIMLLTVLTGCDTTRVIEPQSELTKYIVSELDKAETLVLPVEDAVINNPQSPYSITLVVSEDGKAKFLQLDIGNEDTTMEPQMEDAMFYVDKEIPFNYIQEDTVKPVPEYEQYVVIKKDKDFNLKFLWLHDIYKSFKCEIYLKNAEFGENHVGRGTEPAMKVGE